MLKSFKEQLAVNTLPLTEEGYVILLYSTKAQQQEPGLENPQKFRMPFPT